MRVWVRGVDGYVARLTGVLTHSNSQDVQYQHVVKASLLAKHHCPFRTCLLYSSIKRLMRKSNVFYAQNVPTCAVIVFALVFVFSDVKIPAVCACMYSLKENIY